jgi:hypothetical protein
MTFTELVKTAKTAGVEAYKRNGRWVVTGGFREFSSRKAALEDWYATR